MALIILLTIFIIGTVGFHFIEGWSFVDSFYFTITTLSTVGYGDFAAETTAGKFFAVFYNYFWRRHDVLFIGSYGGNVY